MRTSTWTADHVAAARNPVCTGRTRLFCSAALSRPYFKYTILILEQDNCCLIFVYCSVKGKYEVVCFPAKQCSLHSSWINSATHHKSSAYDLLFRVNHYVFIVCLCIFMVDSVEMLPCYGESYAATLRKFTRDNKPEVGKKWRNFYLLHICVCKRQSSSNDSSTMVTSKTLSRVRERNIERRILV